MRKRWFDATLAALLLLLLAPLVLSVACLVRYRLGSPVLFLQPRIGRYNAVFKLVKFRSMTTQTDESSALLPDAQRLSPFGLWLRRTSLDELPSLWNVLCGHMSLVGPRPLLVQYLPLYSPIQARRHEVRPGVTGWAQVNGRNAISWDRKFELDVWYVDNRSVWLDLKILLLTGLRVFQRRGISAEGSVSMPFFTGSDESKLTSELSQPKPAIRPSTELS
ncbi:sugar transferase [bacterium]|nr:sugar transferase [bacterium]